MFYAFLFGSSLLYSTTKESNLLPKRNKRIKSNKENTIFLYSMSKKTTFYFWTGYLTSILPTYKNMFPSLPFVGNTLSIRKHPEH